MKTLNRGSDARLPTGFPRRRRGSCVPAAYLLSLALPECSVVMGWAGNGAVADEHTWVEHDGVIIDPTIRQFTWWRAGTEVVREPLVRSSAGMFQVMFERRYAEPWTDAGHHYRKFSRWIDPVRSPASADKGAA